MDETLHMFFLNQYLLGKHLNPKVNANLPRSTQTVPDLKNLPLRQDIQGLRALAVLSVIVFHANKTWLPGGFIGVDIFFVISGFLITSIILRAKESGSFSFKNFYLSRVRRITPTYFVMLGVISLCMAILLIPKDFAFYEKSLKAALYFGSNNYFSRFGDYFAPASYEVPLQHTWSLAVEMQFYLLLPVILVFVPHHYLKLLFSALICLLTLYAAYHLQVLGNKQKIYFSLWTRIPEFLVGAWLALSARGKKGHLRLSNVTSWLGIILVSASFLWIDDTVPFPGPIALIPCIGVALIITARQSTLNRILSAPVLVWIGDLSYSLYLWHWPVLAAVRYYSGNYELNLESFIVFILLTAGLTYTSYYWIELPFKHKRSTKKVIPCFTILATITIIPIVAASNLNYFISKPLPAELTRYAPGDAICHGKIVGTCFRGNPSSEREILVLGDSHAAQLNYFFDVVGQTNDFRARVITGSSCVTIPAFDVNRLPLWAQSPCSAQIQTATQFLSSAKEIVVAGMWQYHVRSEAFIEAFDSFLKKATTKGQKVVVMAQIPMFTSDVQRILRYQSLGFPAQATPNPEWSNANKKIAEVVARNPSARFINLSDGDFFSRAPFENGNLIYSDNHHLNELGAQRYGAFATSYFRAELSEINLSPLR